jgi:hypothetical protein
MRLRVLVTSLVVFGLGLLLGFPFVLRRPDAAPQSGEFREFAVRALGYVALTVLVWCAVALGALLMVLRSRREIAREQVEVLRGLVESSLDDHAPKR